jgi:N-acetyl-gamma-glutamyl-phosphate reductase
MGHSAAVLGASGYAGGELLRLLAGHPVVDVVAAGASRSAGRGVAELHPNLAWSGSGELLASEDVVALDVDILFSCLPSGELGHLLAGVRAPVVVDLSDEHRAAAGWVYGLTEFARSHLPAGRIANPGCYPTATLLALVPFVRAGVVSGPAIVDALSGLSGAGRKADDHLLFSAAHSNAGAYGSVDHRHVPEMERGIGDFGESELKVSFTPHLVPMTRGLVVTARAALTAQLDDDSALGILEDAYASERFVDVLHGWPQTKPVTGTNKAHVGAKVDVRNGWLVTSAAIDNLGKGAAGQALQNANLALGLDEHAGLDAVGVWP